MAKTLIITAHPSSRRLTHGIAKVISERRIRESEEDKRSECIIFIA